LFCFSTSGYYCYFVIDSVRKLLDTPSYKCIKLAVFWIVTPCNLAVRYQRFTGSQGSSFGIKTMLQAVLPGFNYRPGQ